MTNYYHVLGIHENASASEIKAAFKRLAVQYHPDKHPDKPKMEEKFKEINLAHQVLSDPYEKDRFDLKLKYERASQHAPRTPYSYEHPYTSRSTRPNPHYTPEIDYRKNAIATAYAFGITFLIALLVMMAVWAKQSYDDHKLEKLLADRRSTYMDALKYFESGDYKNAFETMASLDFFRTEERDMKDFKSSMLDKMIEKGDGYFSNNDFREAISIYELVREFAPEKSLYDLRKKLSSSYRAVDQPNKSINLLKGLLSDGYDIVSTLVTIAMVYKEDMENYQEALEQLIIAHRLVIKRYKLYYGEGYSLVINEKHLPASHFYLYTEMADTYLRLNDPEMAIKASEWNQYVWPDSAISYITSANAYLAIHKKQRACEAFKEARKRKWADNNLKYCN